MQACGGGAEDDFEVVPGAMAARGWWEVGASETMLEPHDLGPRVSTRACAPHARGAQCVLPPPAPGPRALGAMIGRLRPLSPPPRASVREGAAPRRGGLRWRQVAGPDVLGALEAVFFYYSTSERLKQIYLRGTGHPPRRRSHSQLGICTRPAPRTGVRLPLSGAIRP